MMEDATRNDGYRNLQTPKKLDDDNSAALLTATAPLAASSDSGGGQSDGDYRVVPLPKRLPSQPSSNECDEDGFCSNVVITSKYTVWNFLPLFLIESFRKLANAYFLLVSALQTIKTISNTNGFPSTLPALMFILTVDGVLAIIEDRRRHQADDEANSAECHVVTATFDGAATAKMQPTQDPEVSAIAWADLTVGTVVKLRNRETAPADLLILSVDEDEPSDPSGICYVETKSLDGETNLKLRHACDATLHTQSSAQVRSLEGYLRCENPNKVIGRFDGILTMSTVSANPPKHQNLSSNDGDHPSVILQQPVSMKNVILRGCQLRNTDWIYGLVINTGPDTKIMQSSVASRPKWSSINESVNKMIIYLFLFLLLLCMLAATTHVAWMHRNESDQVYLGANRTLTLQWFVTVGQYLLLMYQMIPVSLYVTMSVVMMLQAIFISLDRELYYEPLNVRMSVRSMGLNEELGQISYVFSDKTGTLTCNVMEFRKCSISGVSYGTGMTEIGKATLRRKGIFVPEDDEEEVVSNTKANANKKPKMSYVNFEDDRLENALVENAKATEALFFLHLSLCHTVIPETIEGSSEVRFSASSPDEQALVSAAKYFGFSFESRGLGIARVRVVNKSLMVNKELDSELQEFKILDVLEFTSDRKRMSVVVQNPRGEFWLLTKGADNMIYPLLSKSANTPELLDTTMSHLESFADDALRTLTIAHKHLDESEYLEWSKRFRDANASLEEIEKRKNNLPNKIDALMNEIEQDLELLGATAIEDKLQDHVPRAIARLMQAGMKVWMLTGDKQETAINIAYACSLMDNDMKQLVLNLELFPSVDQVLAHLVQANAERDEDPHSRQAVVIDGECLEVTLAHDRCRDEFLKLAMRCEGVVCCRVSPSQKAEIVTLVRQKDTQVRTLAIGDGANDVAMIQRAHVGVGISGMEGMQAVNSSDYAIAQFYFLEKLLLHHGRLNYRRMAALVGYMFYKNIFLALAQYYFMLSIGASGQKYYSEFSFQMYNLVYTALPIGVLGVFDYDVPWEVGRLFPQLYLVGPRKELFNRYTFFKWLCSAIYESAVVALVVLLGFHDSRSSWGSAPLLQYGVLAFTCVVIVANLKVVMWQMSWGVFAVASWIFGILMYVPATLLLTSSLPTLSPTDYGAIQNTLNQPAYWLVVLLSIVMCLLRHFSWAAIQRRFKPQPWQIVQEAYVLNKGKKQPARMSTLGQLESGGGGKLLYDEPNHYPAMPVDSPSPARLSDGRRSSMSRQQRLSSSSGFAYSYDPQTSLAEAYIARHSRNSASSAISDAEQRGRLSRGDSRVSDFGVSPRPSMLIGRLV